MEKYMLKIKLFEGDWDEVKINTWLEHNANITVVSTNSFANHGGWGYIILYKESDVGNDFDEVD